MGYCLYMLCQCAWLIILIISDHSWCLGEGIFFIPNKDCFLCKKLWYSFYPGVILKVATLSLGTSVTVLVNSCLSTFRERMISYAPVDSLMC